MNFTRIPESLVENTLHFVVACVPEAPAGKPWEITKITSKKWSWQSWWMALSILSQAASPPACSFSIHLWIHKNTKSFAREQKSRQKRISEYFIASLGGLFACKKVLEMRTNKKRFELLEREVTDMVVLLACFLNSSKEIKYLFMQKLRCFMCAFIKYFLPTTLSVCWRKRTQDSQTSPNLLQRGKKPSTNQVGAMEIFNLFAQLLLHSNLHFPLVLRAKFFFLFFWLNKSWDKREEK